MDPITSVLSSGQLPLERYAQVTGRTAAETLERAGRGVIKRAMGITPPASDQTSRGPGGALTHADKVRGTKAIKRDLNILFVPVRLKHKRKERISGAEMVRLHQTALRYKRPGAKMRRISVSPDYVDARKFTALRKKLESHVGRFASGWVAAASKLKVSAPTWVARHGTGRGAVQIDLQGASMSIGAVNYAPRVPGSMVHETQRRLDAAIQYQANAMNRELQFILTKRARELGMQVSAA